MTKHIEEPLPEPRSTPPMPHVPPPRAEDHAFIQAAVAGIAKLVVDQDVLKIMRLVNSVQNYAFGFFQDPQNQHAERRLTDAIKDVENAVRAALQTGHHVERETVAWLNEEDGTIVHEMYAAAMRNVDKRKASKPILIALEMLAKCTPLVRGVARKKSKTTVPTDDVSSDDILEPIYQLRARFSQDWMETPGADTGDGFGRWYEVNHEVYERCAHDADHKGRILRVVEGS